jgi:hypothetical protein
MRRSEWYGGVEEEGAGCRFEIGRREESDADSGE